MEIPYTALTQASAVAPLAQARRVTWTKTLLVLASRTLLFSAFQGVFAAIFWLQGAGQPWAASIPWWPLSALLTNLVSIALLWQLDRQEGARLGELLRFHRDSLRRDLLALLGLMVVLGPVGFLPGVWAASALFGSTEPAYAILLQPLPRWAALLSLLFPLTIAFSELPTYFAYVLPRLEALSGRRWVAIGLAALFLGVQHAALPLVFDLRFMAWRAVMFLPFALLLGVALAWRPRLFPYLMAIHALMDLSLVAMLLGM